MSDLGRNTDLFANLNREPCWLARNGRWVIHASLTALLLLAAGPMLVKAVQQAAYDAVQSESGQ